MKNIRSTYKHCFSSKQKINNFLLEEANVIGKACTLSTMHEPVIVAYYSHIRFLSEKPLKGLSPMSKIGRTSIREAHKMYRKWK